MAGIMGGDLVGMSTVPEAIAARYLGMKVLGISCVTNLAAGITDTPLAHDEVVEVGKRVESELKNLILDILAKL
jgi:purine-nucleoside phosphorylase